MGVVGDYSHLGDPVGMEALASELLLRAESLAGIVASLEREARAMTFEGPAADQFHDEIVAKRRRAERTAAELQQSAHLLRRNAAAVRGDIYEAGLAARRMRDREIDP